MTHEKLVSSVAKATGESRRMIEDLGFGLLVLKRRNPAAEPDVEHETAGCADGEM